MSSGRPGSCLVGRVERDPCVVDTEVFFDRGRAPMWKPAAGFEDTHEAHPTGLIRNARTKRLVRGSEPIAGYRRLGTTVNGRRRSKMWAAIIYETFVGPLAHGEFPDHRDRDPTNNDVGNLRRANKFLNSLNRNIQSPTADYLGVCKLRKKWHGLVKSQGRLRYTKAQSSEKEAAIARDRLALELFADHAEFVSLNYPELIPGREQERPVRRVDLPLSSETIGGKENRIMVAIAEKQDRWERILAAGFAIAEPAAKPAPGSVSVCVYGPNDFACFTVPEGPKASDALLEKCEAFVLATTPSADEVAKIGELFGAAS